MGHIAFYAPMKPPTHPTPSGDREMARNLIQAISTGTDWTVELVSELRIYDRDGDAARQAQLRSKASAALPALVSQAKRAGTRLWVTYHNYYKAPDLLGPQVCEALNIPYVQIESTRARSRLAGPWAGFAAAAEAATDAADIVFYPTALDLITLERDQKHGQKLVNFPPFLPIDALPTAARAQDEGSSMLAVGMMRSGDKLRSYEIIAGALPFLSTPDWKLDIAGDGPARTEVSALFAPFSDRVRFLGELDREALTERYQNAALFIWPGVNEAYGMVYLEAQASGLAVVAQDRDGVRDVLAPGQYPDPEGGPRALAERADLLLSDPVRRKAEGAAARAHVELRHLRPAATRTFWAHVSPLLEQGT